MIVDFAAIVDPWRMVDETVSFVDVANAAATVVAIVMVDAGDADFGIVDELGIAIVAVTVVLSVPVTAICLAPAVALSTAALANAAVTAAAGAIAAVFAAAAIGATAAAGIGLAIGRLVLPVAADDDAVVDGGKESC